MRAKQFKTDEAAPPQVEHAAPTGQKPEKRVFGRSGEASYEGKVVVITGGEKRP